MAYQSVAFMISGRVAPLARSISARIFAPLRALFELACFFDKAFYGATCAPCSAAATAVLVSASIMLIVGVLFCARLAHDDSSLWLA